MEVTKEINENIFREYDIRAIADTELNDDVVYTIGKSYGTYILKDGKETVVIGHDNRLTSKRIVNVLIAGLKSTGLTIINLGLVTTPMYYFAKKHFNIGTGIMVTASHNPKPYNGFKFSFNEIGNAYGPLIEDFKKFTYQGDFITKKGGIVTSKDIKDAYLENIKKSVCLGPRKIKVVIDCGNGTGSTIIKDVMNLFDIDVTYLYCESDGNFPNHIPDPAVKDNMIDLGKKVREVKADFGIGIDGDADRVGITDENGNYLTADLVMLIIYRYLSKTMKNKKAVYDVKCSRTLIDGLKDLNLKSEMFRTGNSYLNIKMQEGFDFGGEYSGHFFFRDKYQGFDDGIYAALRIIEILSNKDCKFSELLSNTNKYYSTEEIKVEVREDNKFAIVDKIKEYVKEKKYLFEQIDGVRVEFVYGFALVRASNTGPNLTVRFEAKTKEKLKEIQDEFMNLIDKYKKIL